jgi:CheY-like chemotaxis protein
MKMEKILLVEDEPITRTHLSELLRNEGYDVDEVGDGTEAVKILDKQRFDLVITDFSMPQLDGARLAERIHRKTPDTPVIFTTGYISEDCARALVAGVAEVIPKPIDPKTLLSTIKRIEEERY